MTDPRLTLDDLCGVEGHPIVRHDCRTADRALGILRCPAWVDDVPNGRLDGDPRWRCGLPLGPHPYPPGTFVGWLACERHHLARPSDVEDAAARDLTSRLEAQRDEARAARAAKLADVQRRTERARARTVAGYCVTLCLLSAVAFVFGPPWLVIIPLVALVKVLMSVRFVP